MLKTNIPLHITKLIVSFLQDRILHIKVADYTSMTKKMYTGIPQGSSLSPSLHSLYINDISISYQTKLHYFLITCFFTLATEITNTWWPNYKDKWTDIFIWMKKCRLSLNITKTVSVLSGHKYYDNITRLKINNHQIEWSFVAKSHSRPINKL